MNLIILSFQNQYFFFFSNNAEALSLFICLGPDEAINIEALVSLVCCIYDMGVFPFPVFFLEKLFFSIPSAFVVLGTIFDHLLLP